MGRIGVFESFSTVVRRQEILPPVGEMLRLRQRRLLPEPRTRGMLAVRVVLVEQSLPVVAPGPLRILGDVEHVLAAGGGMAPGEGSVLDFGDEFPCRGVAHDRGMDEWIYRFGVPGYTGHGIGCWLDEPPRLRAGEEGSLAEGMVLVLEARLGRKGHGGATLTDPVLVTRAGVERLSRVPVRTW